MKYGAFKYSQNQYGKSASLSDPASVSDIRNATSSKSAFTEQFSVSDILVAFKTVLLTLSESVFVTDVFDRVGTFFRTMSEAFSASDSAIRQTYANRSETVTATDSQTKTTVSEKKESASVSDIRTASTSKTVSESPSLSDYVSKMPGITRSESFSVSDVFSRTAQFLRTAIESVGVSDKWFAYLNGARAWLWEKVSKTAGTWLKSAKSEGIWNAAARTIGMWTKGSKPSGAWNAEAKDSTDDWNRTPNP